MKKNVTIQFYLGLFFEKNKLILKGKIIQFNHFDYFLILYSIHLIQKNYLIYFDSI